MQKTGGGPPVFVCRECVRGVNKLKKLTRSELIALDASTRKLRLATAVGEVEIDGYDVFQKRCCGLFSDMTAELDK